MPRRGENIHKRNDNRWESRIIIGREPITGKAIYKSIYGKSYHEVKNKTKSYQENRPTNQKQTNLLTVEDLALLWLEYKKESIKFSTYCNYCLKVQNHIINNIGIIKLADLNNEVLYHFEQQLKTKNKLSNKSMNDIIVIFNQIIKYGIKKKLITNLLDNLKTKRESPKVIQILSTREVNILVNSIKLKFDKKDIGILLSLFMGIRLGEICALQYQDINFEEKTIAISKTIQRVKNPDKSNQKTKIIIDEPKSQNSKRILPIPSFLLNYLLEYKPELKSWKECYILTGTKKYIEPRCYEYYFEKKLLEYDIKKINFHILRHTFASRAIESGMDIKMLSELLGHSDIKLTMQLYIHPTLESKSHFLEKLVMNY